MAVAEPAPENLPPVIKGWVRQLIQLAPLLAAYADRQVEVRLFAHNGKVKLRPTIVLDGGPQQMVSPDGEQSHQ